MLPLSPLQQGLLFHHLLGSDDGSTGSAYTVQATLGLRGGLDMGRLHQAIGALLQRHPNLRAAFRQKGDGDTVQVVIDRVAVPLRLVDAAGRSDVAGVVEEEAARDRGQPFDLTRPPAFRFTVVRADDQNHHLIVTNHHILLDGWSLPVLLRELFALYVNPDGSGLPDATPFKTYLQWLARQDQAAGMGFWSQELAGLEDPTLVASGDSPQVSFGSTTYRLDETLTAGLESRCRELGVTTSNAVEAAWAVVLGQLTRQQDVVFGSTVSGRPPQVPGVENMVGLFINTIPVRTQLTADSTLSQLVRARQQRQAAAMGHEHLQLSQVQSTANLGDLFDTLVVFENYPLDPAAMQLPGTGLSVSSITSSDRTHYPLTLVGIPGPQLELRLDHRDDVASRHTPQQILKRVAQVLTTLVDAPETPLSEVDLLGQDRGTVLDFGRGTPATAPCTTLEGLVHAHAGATPTAPALIHGSRGWSYAQLDTAAEAMAQDLALLGVHRGDVVALLLPRSAHMVVAALATQRLGAAFLPVDPTYPAERIAFMLDDAAPRAVIVDQPLPAGSRAAATLVIDPSCLEARPGAPVIEHDRPNPDDAAYVIYTSGSTGRPKGVVVTHAGVGAFVESCIERFASHAQARVLQFASPSFDASILEMCTAFGPGAALVIPTETPLVGETLAQQLRDHRISHTLISPASLTTLDAPDLPDLECLIVGGDATPPAVVERWAGRCRMVNAYGPTEATVMATTSQAMQGAADANIIGTPVTGMQLLVLDDQLRLCPVGVPGELHIAGAGVARGYLHRPSLTAERFLPNPFGGAGHRMYRTGDLVSWQPDGRLVFHGRTDDQVKVRGYRIELREIEAVLGEHPPVRACTVVARTDTGHTTLAAYVVAAPAGVDAAQLRDHLASRLPSHMVPASITFLDQLPMTANGSKVDQRALPVPAAASEPQHGRVPTEGPAATLTQLIGDVLGVAHVDPDASFFDLGGDSIMSIQLVNRARAAGLVISPKQVFELRSAARLAQACSQVASAGAESAADAVGEVAATPVMHWLGEQGDTFQTFHQSMLVRTPAGITPSWMRSAVAALWERHDALRGRLLDGGSLDIPAADSRPPHDVLTVVDAARWDDETLQAAQRAHAQDAVSALDPSAGHMCRFVWFDRGDHPGRLLMVIHHLVIDGVSWRILLEDLADLHAGRVQLPLPRTGSSLRSWSRHLDRSATAPAVTGDLDRWLAITEPAPLLGNRPLDRSTDRASSAQAVTCELGSDLTRSLLRRVPAAFHATMNEVLLSSLAVAVSRWSDGRVDQITVDVEGHGRTPFTDDIDLTRTVGWFTSIHPVRVTTQPLPQLDGPDLDDRVKAARAQLQQVPDGVSYGVLRYLNPQTRSQLAERPTPRIGFNYLGRFSTTEQDWAVVGEEVLGGGIDLDTAMPHSLEINALTRDRATGPTLAITLGWPQGMFDEGSVDDLAQHWIDVLTALVDRVVTHDGGGRTPRDLPLLPNLDQAQVDTIDQELGTDTEVLPLTPMQEGLVFHALYDTHGRDLYQVQVKLTVEGDLDTDRLRACLDDTVRAHPALSSGFWNGAGVGPVAFLPRELSVPWRLLDHDETDLDAVMDAELRRRFDLDRPPLIRAVVLPQTMPDGSTHHHVILTLHHLLVDGWSMPRIVQELFTRYAGEPVEPSADLRDYLTWLAEQDMNQALAGWRERLHGVTSPTRISEHTDRATPAGPGEQDDPTGGVQQVEVRLTLEDTRALTRAARQRGVTVNTLVRTAWALTLARHTGRTDVVFGSTTSGRPAALTSVESMIGLFINTVPTRVALAPAESLSDLTARVQAEQTSMLDQQHVPLARIQDICGGGDLFDTLLVFENYPLAGDSQSLSGAGLSVCDASIDDATHYPLTIVADPGEELSFSLKYLDDALTSLQVNTLGGDLVDALRTIVTDPARTVAQLTGTADDMRQSMLDSNGQPLLSEPATTIVDAFTRQAHLTPHRVAVRHDGRDVTYEELEARANTLANELVAGGVCPDDRVGLMTERCLDQLVATLAILTAGAAYVPLDTRSPDTRLHDIITGADVRLLITDPANRERLDDSGVPRITVAGAPQWSAAAAPQVELHPDNLAYLMFTSGSTGTPKGVAVTHANVVDLVRHGGWSDNHRVVLVHSPHAFDASTFEVWVPLLTGRRLVIAPAGDLSVHTLTGLIREEGVTGLWLTAGLFRLLAEENVACFAGLREVWSGGDVVPAHLVSRVLAANPDLVFANGYGPTETTTFATSHPVTADRPLGTSMPIGRPLDGMQCYVLDPFLRPVPRGVVGELYIAGAGLARGYHAQPDRTAERFVANPFSSSPSRMYRTGDLVRWSAGEAPQPLLEFVGRIDDQIKIRGFRIEIGEIESALAACDGVRQAAVVVVQSPAGNKQLAGYVVLDPAAATDPQRLRAELAEVLPDYMVPSGIKVLDEIPLSGNGKVDRRALPALDAGADRAVRLPRNAREALLAELFADVLEVPTIGIDDDFFDLGGNSLLATKLVSRLRTALGADVAIRSIFEHPTVADLAPQLGAGGTHQPLVAHPDRGELAPTSFGQRRLWFLNEMDAANSPYKIPICLRLRGSIDQQALAGALRDVVERHEVLRTVYVERDGQPWQQVLPMDEVDLQLEVCDVSEEHLEDELEQRVGQVFDLARDIPLKVSLLHTAPQDARLLLLMHHIAGDGWSMASLAQDFSTAYAARIEGHAPSFTALPVQYADYSIWQHDMLENDQDPDSPMNRQIRYWRENLADIPQEIALPADRPHSPDEVPAAGLVEFEIPAALYKKVRALGQQHAASPFMTLQAAVSALLTKLGAGHDIPIGSPIAGRTDAALDDLVGFFVNTIVIRNDTSGDPTFSSLLDRVQESVLSAYANQDVPFDRLVEIINPERAHGRNPLFQVLLVVQNNSTRPVTLPGVDVEVTPVGVHAAQFDLSFDFTEITQPGQATGVRVRLDYDANVFDPQTADALADRLLRLLEAVVGAPDEPLSGIDLLGADERELLLHTWNETSRDEMLSDVVESVYGYAALTPDAVALSDDSGAVVTYEGLRRRSGWLTGHLRTAQAQPGEIAAVLLDRCVTVPVALVGILGAGAAYTPLDVDAPLQRSAGLVDDCRARWLITDAAHQELAHQVAQMCTVGVEVVVLSDQEADIDTTVAHANDLAYVLYTSGSTGRPKGAMIHRSGMHNHLMAKVEDLHLGGGDVVLQNAPLSFDVSIWQMLTGFLVGARTHVVGRDIAVDPQSLFDETVAAGVSIAEVVPSMLRAALDHWDVTGQSPDLHVLRYLLVTGEALAPALCRRWFDRYRNLPLVNAYGPTECSDDVTHAVLTADSDLTGQRVPIGTAVRNTRLYVLDAAMQPVPIGGIGELFVGGVGVGHGYLGDPVKTALAFVPDPFSTEPGARLYRTGDQVRYNHQGQLEFLGRNDHQVKIRGQRIELSEIEACLHDLDGVRDALVVVRPGPTGDKALVGYVLGEVDPNWVRQEVSLRLPNSMVPSAVVAMDVFPLTPNGKVDRAALPEPDYDTTTSRLPESAIEFLLAEIFSEVLQRGSVGVDDDFFALGGHSLLATRLLNRVRAITNADLGVRTIFENPTVASLAAAVESATSRVPLVPQPRPQHVPLSPVQRRLWFLNQLEQGAAYHVPMALRLRGDLQVDALQSAVGDLVSRHEVLRTLFPDHDGVPYQRVVDEDLVHIPVPVIDVDQVSLEPKIVALTAPPFDLSRDLPIRATLLRLGHKDHVLAIVLHHIACDGGSLAPLSADLVAAYSARAAGQAPQWEPLPVQSADYALWQEARLGGEDDPSSLMRGQLDYWVRELADLPALATLPTDRARPVVSDFAARTIPVEIDHALHTALDELGQRHGVSLAMVLQAAWIAVLHRCGAGSDLPVAVPVSGRDDEALTDLIGFFVNTLVLRHQLTPADTFTDLLDQVRRVNLGAFSHQDVPFDRVVEALNPTRSLATHPLAQIAYSFQPAEQVRASLPNMTVDVLPTTITTAKFDLSLKMGESRTAGGEAAGILGVLEFRTDLFAPQQITDLVDRFLGVLASVTADDQVLVADLDVSSARERHLVLQEWNDTATREPSAPFWRQIEQQAVRTPNAVAVSDGDRNITYAELDQYANALARELIHHGIGAEDFIALALPRSWQLICAVLAVGKAGAAYLPIDVNYPPERIALLMDTIAPRMVVTTGQHRQVAQPQGGHPVPVITVADAPAADPAAVSDDERRAEPDLRHPAYAIFTSGSTGRPKGVVIEQYALADYLTFAANDYEGVTGTALLHSPISFDLSVTSMLVPLVDGGCVRVTTLQEEDPTTSALLQETPPTFLKATPSHLPLLDQLPAHYAPTQELLLGGETLTGEVVDAWREEHPDVTVLNMYGPTETTVNCTQFRITPDMHIPRGALPIGRPLDNHRAYVLDERLHPQPVGVPGELYMAGNGLARGYFAQPDLTAARFVANPFGQPGERMYRTGDIVRWNPDGTLTFLHRADDQVKVRGFRIELGEIQAVLTNHPGVREAVVVTRTTAGVEQLVAYVCPVDGQPQAPVADLRQHAAQQLPPHMVPDLITFIDAIPLTPNGKVDKKALPEPSMVATEGRAPADATEMQIAQAFADILALDHVNAGDSFFDLGGHSLLATRLLGRLRADLQADLSIRDLFEAPTVEGLAERLRDGGSTTSAFDCLIPLHPAGDRVPLFCVHPASGVSWSYAGLIRHLGADQPIYGLQSPGLDGHEPVLGSVPQLAGRYIREMRSVQPHGPYNLLGWSFGGVVAHEMVAQLEEQGETVDVFAMLDSLPKTDAERGQGPEISEVDLFENLFALAGYDSELVVHSPDRVSVDRAATAQLLHARGGILGSLTEAQLGGAYEVYMRNCSMARTFQPRTCQASPVLFVATLDESEPHSETRWDPHLSGAPVTRVDVPFRHNDMTTPAALKMIGGALAARRDHQ